MELFQNLALGFGIALTLTTLSLAIVGCILGTIIGALPGLGPSNGVAILIPLAFTLELDATQALVLMTSVYYGAMYGGAISSVALGIPGASTAVATTFDGRPLALQGRAHIALMAAALASFAGATISNVLFTAFAPMLASVALDFWQSGNFCTHAAGLCHIRRAGW